MKFLHKNISMLLRILKNIIGYIINFIFVSCMYLYLLKYSVGILAQTMSNESFECTEISIMLYGKTSSKIINNAKKI